MQITMLHTRRISKDAFAIRQLKEGETYDVADEAARKLVRDRQAVEVGAPRQVQRPCPFDLAIKTLDHPRIPTNPATLLSTGLVNTKED